MRTGVPERPLQIEHADLTLLGNREENQDRVAVAIDDDAAFLAVVDGMGGHADGARAAEVAIRTMIEQFWEASRPLFDPDGFLHLTLGLAHEAVVALGRGLPQEVRPRATCAACVVQGANAYWAHIGDSRIYQLRHGRVHERTRDHSHVELLLREGLIAERDAKNHPMRNFVECCLGGDLNLPDMSITACKRLRPGDVLVLCTDGLWTGLEDEDIAAPFEEATRPVGETLRELAERAVARNAPHSDNTSAVALRWQG